MEFKKYQHIERVGTDEVDGIDCGKCYIFYKVDGTNASVWFSDGRLRCGSRNRELTLDNDNQGFMEYIYANKDKYLGYFNEFPNRRLFMEWLVPHTVKNYRGDAWRKPYIFDVTVDKESVDERNQLEYIPYDLYKDSLEKYELDYVPPLAIVNNPTYETLIKCLPKTSEFLMIDGSGEGEGIVIKNYNFYNKYGRQTWAKIVSNEFKENHHKTMGAPEINNEVLVEMKAVDKFLTPAMIEKEYQKIINEVGSWSTKLIPRLLQTIWHTFIEEEIWNIIKECNSPKINFKTLNTIVIQKIKEVKRNIF